MLAYILAVLVGIGSVGLYLAAFFFPEIHRKHDFIWSGVGCFYALSLWIYARQETGGILVGQAASVALLGWFGWQTFKLRRQLVPVNQQTPIPTATKLQNRSGLKQSVPTAANPTPTPAKPAVTVTPPPTTIPPDRPPAIRQTTPAIGPAQPPVSPPTAGNPETSPPLEIVTESISPKHLPSDAIQTAAKLDSENWE